MKTFALALLAATTLAAPAFAADPIEGTWQTQPDDGAYAYVKIVPCGAKFCGAIDRTFNKSGEYKSENQGKMIVIDMAPEGGGKYRGKVWRPSNNKVYIGKISVTGNQMALAGCIMGGLLCSSQEWKRLK